MVKVDLITGFLGSGKTTFIKEYAAYLMKQGLNIGILENDYGAVNVDMMLLQDLEGNQCELEMVAGGCDYDCHKRRFKTKLIAMGMCGYDRVLVEPSGIFDVDEFFDVLFEEPLNRWYQIGNVLAIVDAGLEENLSRQSDYLLASEVADAGLVLLSKVQEVSEQEINTTIAHMNQALKDVKCPRRIRDDMILAKDWSKLTQDDWKRISSCGYQAETYEKLQLDQDGAYDSLYYMNLHLSLEELQVKIRQLLADESCGKIFRIKGFMPVKDGSWMEINATQKQIRLTPIARGQEILIVIGEELVENRVNSYWNAQQ